MCIGDCDIAAATLKTIVFGASGDGGEEFRCITVSPATIGRISQAYQRGDTVLRIRARRRVLSTPDGCRTNVQLMSAHRFPGVRRTSVPVSSVRQLCRTTCLSGATSTTCQQADDSGPLTSKRTSPATMGRVSGLNRVGEGSWGCAKGYQPGQPARPAPSRATQAQTCGGEALTVWARVRMSVASPTSSSPGSGIRVSRSVAPEVSRCGWAKPVQDLECVLHGSGDSEAAQGLSQASDVTAGRALHVVRDRHTPLMFDA